MKRGPTTLRAVETSYRQLLEKAARLPCFEWLPPPGEPWIPDPSNRGASPVYLLPGFPGVRRKLKWIGAGGYFVEILKPTKRRASRITILGVVEGPGYPLKLLVRSCDYRGFISLRAKFFARVKEHAREVGLRVLGKGAYGLRWQYFGFFRRWRYREPRWINEMPIWFKSSTTGRWHLLRSDVTESLRYRIAMTFRH